VVTSADIAAANLGKSGVLEMEAGGIHDPRIN